MTDPRQRWLDVHPLPDRQGRVQQMDYLDGYILGLQDALLSLKTIAEALSTLRSSNPDLEPDLSVAQVGQNILARHLRRELGAMLNGAQGKLREIRDPVVAATIRHASCTDTLCGDPEPHTHP